MDTQPLQLTARELSDAPDIPLAWRLVAIMVILSVSIPLSVHMYRMQSATWPGPPLTIRMGAPNLQGDVEYMQQSGHYDPNTTLYGVHDSIVWNRNAHRLVLCSDVVHNEYANQTAAQQGIIDNPGDRSYWSSIHPKLGRRGCWHILAVL